MKIRSALRLMCNQCYMVRRGKKRFVYCHEVPKHKQRQGFHTIAFDEVATTQASVSPAASSSIPTYNLLKESSFLSNMLRQF